MYSPYGLTNEAAVSVMTVLQAVASGVLMPCTAICAACVSNLHISMYSTLDLVGTTCR